MNKRIKELEQQAWEHAGHFGEVYVEKFTQLIVKECTDTLTKVLLSYDGSETDADYMSGVDDSIDILKEHFGIEK